MTKIKRLFVMIVAIAAISLSASAQFAIGPRLGATINSMKFNKEVADADNLAGFTGGIQAEFTVPIINLGFDASIMYVHRKVATEEGTNETIKDFLTDKNFRSRDYVEIPINVKYKIGLPIVGKIVSPYVFTGPSFAFLASKKAISEAYENKTVDISWNVGVGLQLFTHLQIGASYGFGLNNTIKAIDETISTTDIEGKNKYWTVTAAYLF
jgi:hypothetical protein